MGLCKLRMLSHLSAESEISKFDVIRFVDEDIGGLYVSMQDFAASTFFISRSIVTVLEC